MEDGLASEKYAWTREHESTRSSPVRGGWIPVLSVAVVLTLAGCNDATIPALPEVIYLDGPARIGEPCTAPPMGESDIQGHAFGVTFRPPKQVNFSLRNSILDVSAAADLEVDTESCKVDTDDLFLRIVSFWLDATIGDPLYVPSTMFVSLENFRPSPEPYGQLLSNFGTVTFDGYDPSTHSLCGRVDVLFNDDEDGYLAGSFKAPMRCLDPAPAGND